jgi:hypothetical protein
MDRLCGLALCAADAALLGPADMGGFSAATTAIVLGTAEGCHKSDEEYFRGAITGQLSPRLFAYTLPSAAVGEVSIHHQLLGPGLGIVSGRTAGLEALCEAQTLLASGQAAFCLVLGCEVAAPVLPQRPEDAELCDGGVAVLLVGDAAPSACATHGYLAATAAAYCPDDPEAALLAAVAEVAAQCSLPKEPIRICDPQTRTFIPKGLAPVQVCDVPRTGAAAPLAVFARLAALPGQDEKASYLVLAADPSGQGGAALWCKMRSVTSRTASLLPGRRVA